MAGISPEEVKKVARLASLETAGGELEKVADGLSDVLEHIAMLEKLDTENVSPMSQAGELKNVFRKDCVTAIFEGGKSLENAPEREQYYFSVPRIVA